MMKMNLIKGSLRYPVVTIILTLLVVAVGINAFLNMPKTEDPTITIRTGLVIAQYPGATSEQVELQVTRTLEKHIFKFPEVRREKTFSTSRHGLVVINVELQDYVKNADLFWSRLRHEMNETRATELPQGVRGPIVNSDFGDTVAMLIAIHGKHYGYRELRDYANLIEDELRSVHEVGKIARYGEQSEQIRITGNLNRIAQYITDPLRIIDALQQRNVIESSGSMELGRTKVPLRTTDLFTTEEQIGNVLVDVSKTGQPVYIRDFARVERCYQDPVFLVRSSGEPSVLLSVEMQKKKNIVELGEKLSRVLIHLRSVLPPDVQLDLIADQPRVVKERTATLTREFLLAIGSVVLVTLLLLPFRVALIAALAIPVTFCATLGIMNALGIDLHQVSIASLILVLGIVVDDAIVIADNYLDLLDRGVSKKDAAFRSATEIIVPVFTATITIICSFLPILILAGATGEFIMALPLTVAIALSVSFIVAVLLTPVLCRFFIKEGLHNSEENEEVTGAKKKFSLLDRLQMVYKKSITFFMARKSLALAMGGSAVVLALGLFLLIPQQFFPSAERNQFVIDVWMRQGTRIEATDAVIRRIENYLNGRPEVAGHASFAGQSAPRFYYNVNPQQPDGAYGQLIVTTKSEKDTPKLVAKLRESFNALVPEALVIVKELQQGMPLEAPVEVRITGDDIGVLKTVGSQVEDILRAVPSSQYVHSDYFNDSYMVDVNVENELSNRLGLTEASISRLLSGSFDGAPVSTFWEGDRPVTILLRLEPGARSSFTDVTDAYVTSPLTHASVPLRSVATLTPEWETSRIVRRNGVKTLTLRSFVKEGVYPSTLLKKVDPKIQSIKLPPGYRIEYGGEKYNQDEVFPQMLVALAISLVAIFLVLLIQFRNIAEPLIVMASIPLALLGVVVGLIITRNPFGFTAFMGVVSLCGIVVRNSIILIDYIKEKVAEGRSLEEAAMEAGERRLRPIFLTTMAAAVGVTPMILSGSSLWSPLASVISVGLIFSMFFTLLVVPVLFVVVRSRVSKLSAPAAGMIVAVILLFGSGQVQAETKQLDLPEAIELALAHNSNIKIARARVEESQARVRSALADYFPHLSSESTYMGLTNEQLVTIPQGSLGTVPGLGPFPMQDTSIDQGSKNLFVANVTLSQPLSHLFKINEAHNIASAENRGTQAELRKAETEITFNVHKLYYGLLMAQKLKDVARAGIAASEEALRESGKGVDSGALLDVAVMGSRVQHLQNKQTLLSTEIQISDLNAELNDLLGLPLDTQAILSDIKTSADNSRSREMCIKGALLHNPEIIAARESVKKAESAVNASYYEYIPDIGAFGRYIYQDGVPFVTNNIGVFGVQMKWNIFDWGKRGGVVGQRKAQLTQAKKNLSRLEKRVEVDVDKAYRKLTQTKMMIDVAQEELALQRENLRLSANRLTAGTITEAQHAGIIASAKKSEWNELQARLNYELALAELDRVVGVSLHSH